MSKTVKLKLTSKLCNKIEQVTDMQAVAEEKEVEYLHTCIFFNLHRN